MLKILNYWAGEFQEPAKKKYLENVEPATGEVFSFVPDSSEQDIGKALECSQNAFAAWSNLKAEQRAEYLANIASEIENQKEALAAAESKDTGKPYELALKVDIPRAAENFLFFSRACTQLSSEVHDMGAGGLNYTLREPLGTVACISPWNLPLYLLTWKIAPALASGNCVIAKPSELSPMTAHLLAKICHKVGLPKGVLSIIHGQGQKAGAEICGHSSVKAVSFTGGTKTGQSIAKQLAPTFKKLSLELGGKNPSLIFSDCDLEATVEQMVRASFSNQGQICLCASRIYIEKDIYPIFLESFIQKTKQLVVGDPLDKKSNLGSLISSTQLDKVLSYIELAKKEGGEILYGGSEVKMEGRCKSGYFVEPTIIANLKNSSRINQEEIFGPVVTVQPFSDEKEALQLANDCTYGLSASVWSKDVKRCHDLSRRLQAGIIWINSWMLRDLRTPFGGYKNSGLGREGGMEAFRFFTQTKNVCFPY